jgi:ribonuclease P protein component
MLPRHSRLSQDWLISKVRRRGQRVKGRYSLIFYLPARSATSRSRCAVVVAKQVSKRAVDRNLVKRRIHETLQQVFPRLRPGYQLVISLSPAARLANYQSLQNDTISLLLKAHLIN